MLTAHKFAVGINFNDGAGGGSVIEENLIFNQCRESTDHGPFNSVSVPAVIVCSARLVIYALADCPSSQWDRNMYLMKQPNDAGTPSVFPQFNHLRKNILVANYQSQEGVDNDDGSGKTAGERYLNRLERARAVLVQCSCKCSVALADRLRT